MGWLKHVTSFTQEYRMYSGEFDSRHTPGIFEDLHRVLIDFLMLQRVLITNFGTILPVEVTAL